MRRTREESPGQVNTDSDKARSAQMFQHWSHLLEAGLEHGEVAETETLAMRVQLLGDLKPVKALPGAATDPRWWPGFPRRGSSDEDKRPNVALGALDRTNAT
jgi:hypothetical protein